MTQRFVLGDEAVAEAAVHAGIAAAYGYPGTPSTEILEHLIGLAPKRGFAASWCVNEKTAYEQALGVSMAGGRAIVTMKHVGLNVAADPFMNSSIITINGGLVVVVADDPGMHSSQNEQDTRYYADFARTPCFEPCDQQQAYDMTLEAFELSEKHGVPVVLRLVTRLAHSRAPVKLSAEAKPRPKPAPSKATDSSAWILMPANARRQWHRMLEKQTALRAYSEATDFNPLSLSDKRLGIITTGVARNYYLENASELGFAPSHLHIGAYPIPEDKVRKLCAHVERVLVLEEGYPYVERLLRGILPQGLVIEGKLSGKVPAEGELNPDLVRLALGLEVNQGWTAATGLPGRPPQLCQGCPHADTYNSLKLAIAQARGGARGEGVVTADIGCYTLGALPPYSAVESCVCMGASIGMAKGASDAGLKPAVAIIGDSTFLHSGIAPLIDAVSANTDMTLIIVDNQAVAMTGGQQTILPSQRLKEIILGVGVNPEHLHVVDAHPRAVEKNAALIRSELEYKGLSVIIAVRECIETAKRKKQAVQP